MPKYGVSLPVTGQIYVEVDADDEESAIDAALEKELTNKEKRLMEWETIREVVRGNVFSGMLRQADAELLSE